MRLACAGLAVILAQTTDAAARQPNIVIVMTDDQGWGDFAANGNPHLRTPNLDRLRADSARFTNFHVDPTCSPTRAALMTGQHSLRAGVWHTGMGRSILATEKVTLAERLRDAGYSTAIFGKWHLGDNYPFRAQDQGFSHSFTLGGGGVGQTPDYWGNTQYDGRYYLNGRPVPAHGWSTDVWFDAATDYVRAHRTKPFFLYLTPNAPHSPFRDDAAAIRHFEEQGVPHDVAAFYAMIERIDRRVGRFRDELARLGLARDTIFVFLTDNGSAIGDGDWKGRYAGGLRGNKGAVYDGGHRVPLWISWPGGKLGSRDIDDLAAHYDLVPTLLELVGGRKATDVDGISLVPALRGGTLPAREVVVTQQRVETPSIDRPSAVLTSRWRLVVGGKAAPQLFDAVSDPEQRRDVAAAQPGVVAALIARLKHWWADTAPKGPVAPHYAILGHAAEPVSRLTAMDWTGARPDADFPWIAGFRRASDPPMPYGWVGRERDFEPLTWNVTAARRGKYRIAARLHDRPARDAIGATTAIVEVDGQPIRVPIAAGAPEVTTLVPLAVGPHRLRAWFEGGTLAAAGQVPAFYVYAERVG